MPKRFVGGNTCEERGGSRGGRESFQTPVQVSHLRKERGKEELGRKNLTSECTSKIEYLASQWESLSPNCPWQQFSVLQKWATASHLAILSHLQGASFGGAGGGLGTNAVAGPATGHLVNYASHCGRVEQYVFMATHQIVRGFLFATQILRCLKNKPKHLW